MTTVDARRRHPAAGRRQRRRRRPRRAAPEAAEEMLAERGINPRYGINPNKLTARSAT